MSGLFIALFLDEEVDVLVADLVRARGFDALTTYEAGHSGQSDDQQLAYAASQGRVILTHNRRDFEVLAQSYAVLHHDHAGMILAVRRSLYDIAHRLLRILNHVTADEMVGQLRYI